MKVQLKSHFIDYFYLMPTIIKIMAGVKGLEPSAPCVTGTCSNQLSYTPVFLVGSKGLEPLTPSV